jgi:AcrR family transcriptional regulator
VSQGAPARDARDDRRVRRTRRLLREALFALVLEKGYDRVTVRDVLERADVGRATFYEHFRDKDDLLVSGADELRALLRRHLAEAAAAGEAGERLELASAVFEHAAAHRQVYRALVGRRAGTVVQKYAREQLATLLREHIEQVATSYGVTPAVPGEVTAEYLVNAFLGLLSWWLDGDTPYAPQEMGRFYLRLTKAAFASAFTANESAGWCGSFAGGREWRGTS